MGRTKVNNNCRWYNILRQAPGKNSLRVKRRIAAWDDDFLASLVSR